MIATRRPRSSMRAMVARIRRDAVLVLSLSVWAAAQAGVAHAAPAETAVTEWGASDASRDASSWAAGVHSELARVYLQNGATDVASDEARRALAIEPDNRHAAHVLALVAVQHGDVSGAADFFERALAMRGARHDTILMANYETFLCARDRQCASRERGASSDGATGISGQLRAQSIAIDNSAASLSFREPLNDGRTGQARHATGGTMDHRIRQENSSEELRDE